MYTVILTKTAQKQLEKLPASTANQLVDVIRKLADNPRPAGCKKLAGRPAWRVRKGDYRIIYEIQDEMLIVQVVTIGHRGSVYDL